jgi:hypothetical protein
MTFTTQVHASACAQQGAADLAQQERRILRLQHDFVRRRASTDAHRYQLLIDITAVQAIIAGKKITVTIQRRGVSKSAKRGMPTSAYASALLPYDLL